MAAVRLIFTAVALFLAAVRLICTAVELILAAVALFLAAVRLICTAVELILAAVALFLAAVSLFRSMEGRLSGQNRLRERAARTLLMRKFTPPAHAGGSDLEKR